MSPSSTSGLNNWIKGIKIDSLSWGWKIDKEIIMLSYLIDVYFCIKKEFYKIKLN